jgi:hypothetical protein
MRCRMRLEDAVCSRARPFGFDAGADLANNRSASAHTLPGASVGGFNDLLASHVTDLFGEQNSFPGNFFAGRWPRESASSGTASAARRWR